ncbi:hypothetical protein [uncultured Bacteroides sp.]|uniref:hypothetical protein n=1 Tax=uncultured Bacteroides sp. TaxID=162156 RepID=UPI002AA7F891|nr:hypothetical protein [uncultured Bacteroides sp.]
MRIFATKEMEEVKGCFQKFEKLSINGKYSIDAFEAEISSNPQYFSEYKTILSYMNIFANGASLPHTKFRMIEGGKSGVNEYEFKSKQLRIYACSIPGGKLIIMGGYKNTQKNDIKNLHKLVKEFFDFRKK